MDIRQLEAFVYTVKYQSFSLAAQKLYISQPTVSAHISSLEEEFHTQLFSHQNPVDHPPPQLRGRQRFNRSELETTETELIAMAAPATTGLSHPKTASGIPRTL